MDSQKTNSLSAIVRLRKIEIPNWESKKDNPKIKRLAELLIKTEGQASRPPIVRKPDLDKEVYEIVSDEEIIIAAKLAGLAKLVVLITQEKTDALAEMEALLNEKEVKPEPKPEPKPASKIDELKRTIQLMETLKKVNYRELQKKLKAYRKEGKTNIKLNRTKAALYLELKRIEGK